MHQKDGVRLVHVLNKHLNLKNAFAERFKAFDGLVSRVSDWLKNRDLDEQRSVGRGEIRCAETMMGGLVGRRLGMVA